MADPFSNPSRYLDFSISLSDFSGGDSICAVKDATNSAQ